MKCFFLWYRCRTASSYGCFMDMGSSFPNSCNSNQVRSYWKSLALGYQSCNYYYDCCNKYSSTYNRRKNNEEMALLHNCSISSQNYRSKIGGYTNISSV